MASEGIKKLEYQKKSRFMCQRKHEKGQDKPDKVLEDLYNKRRILRTKHELDKVEN